MNTYFFNLIDRVVKICCQKKIDGSRPPECDAADISVLSVLSIENADQDKANKDNNLDNS